MGQMWRNGKSENINNERPITGIIGCSKKRKDKVTNGFGKTASNRFQLVFNLQNVQRKGSGKFPLSINLQKNNINFRSNKIPYYELYGCINRSSLKIY